MSRFKFDTNKLIHLLFGLLFAISLSAQVQLLMGFREIQWSNQVVLMMFLLLMFSLLTRFYKITIGIVMLIVGYVVYQGVTTSQWHVFGLETMIYNVVRWMITLNEFKQLPPPYMIEVLVLLVSLVSFIVFIKARSGILSLLLITAPLFYIETMKLDNTWFIFYVIGLVSITTIAFRTKQMNRPSWAVLLSVLVVVFMAQSVLQPTHFFNHDFSRWLDEFNVLPGGERRSDFSLGTVGYSYSNTRIGGPVQLSDEPYMRVSGSGNSFYLRGTIFNEFDHNVWTLSDMEDAKRFDTDTNLGELEEVFHIQEVQEFQSLYNAFMYSHVEIIPIDRTFRSTFIGGSPVNLQHGNDDPENYFNYNDDGQVVSSTQIGPDGYKMIDYFRPTRNHMLMRLIPANIYHNYEIRRTVNSEYQYADLVLEHDPVLYDLVYDKLDNDPNEFLVIHDIIDHFNNNYAYSLSVPDVPFEDSVLEWFLENKVGYCVYYGSLMTVLLQDLGFDARYVEGFVVPKVPESDTHSIEVYERVVSSSTAHAWTEVYVNQLGWMPIDPTSGSHLDQLETGNVDIADEDGNVIVDPVDPTDPINPEPVTPLPNTPVETSVIMNLWLIGFVIFVLIGLIVLYQIDCVRKRGSRTYLLSHFKDRERILVVYVWKDLLRLNKDVIKDEWSVRETCEYLIESLRIEGSNPEIITMLEGVVYGRALVSSTEAAQFLDAYARIYNQKEPHLNTFRKLIYKLFVECYWVNR